MLQDHHRIAIATRFEGLDERIAALEEEFMIPAVYYRGNIAFVGDPTLTGQFTSELDSDLVIVTMRATTLSVVVEDPVTGADPYRSVLTDTKGPFPSILEDRSLFRSLQ
jgi:hypothetical protein